MTTAIRLLALYVGCGVAVLQAFLFLIARFYQEKSGSRTRYGLFLMSMLLTLTGEMLYWGQGVRVVGNMVADLLLLCGGCVLAGNGFLLHRAMTQGR